MKRVNIQLWENLDRLYVREWRMQPMVVPFLQCMVGRRLQTKVRPPGDAWMEEAPILTEGLPIGILLESVAILGETLVKKFMTGGM